MEAGDRSFEGEERREMAGANKHLRAGIERSSRVWVGVVVIGIVLAVAGCALYRIFFPPKGPGDYDYHTHRLTFYAKTINQDYDTLGIRGATLPFVYYTFRRPPRWRDDRSSYTYGFPETLNVEITMEDADFQPYLTDLRHFVGWQEEFGGDTAYFSVLDSVVGWEMDIRAASDYLTLVSGESLHLHSNLPSGVPDTVRGYSEIEIEVIFDMDGLFEIKDYGPTGKRVILDSSKVYYHQR